MGKTFPLPKPLKQGGTGCEAVVVKKEEDSSGRSSSPENEMGGGLGGNRTEGIVVGRTVGEGERRVIVVEKRDGKSSNRGRGRKAVGKREEEEEEEEEEEDGTGAGTGGCGCDSGGVRGRRDKGKDGRVVVEPRGSVGEGWLRPFNPEFFGDLDVTSKYYLDYCTSLTLSPGSTSLMVPLTDKIPTPSRQASL